MTAYRLNRDISTEDEEFSSFNEPKGTIVYRFRGATYGCIGPGGVAVTLIDGEYPFGQVPWSALDAL